MAQKKINLAAALADTQAADAPAKPAMLVAGDKKQEPVTARRDREGMTNVAGWFPLAVKFELEELRLQRSRELGRKVTVQELMAEALNDLFKKYGRPELAPGRRT